MLVKKVLKFISKTRELKVTIIVEANDLNKMELDELHGSLTTHEMIFQGNDETTKKKKKHST
jgi:hypothetical protein